MAFVPGKRMGAPPRSLAADAHDRIMVRDPNGPTGYKAVARRTAPAGKLRLGRDDHYCKEDTKMSTA